MSNQQLYGDLYQQFSESGRNAISLAMMEARTSHHNYVGTEHLLLGILSEEGGCVQSVLQALKAEPSVIRQQILIIISKGKEEQQLLPRDITPTPRTLKELELAIDEAICMNDHHPSSEHLLLGFAREGESIGWEALQKMGLSLDVLRKGVKQYQRTGQNAGNTMRVSDTPSPSTVKNNVVSMIEHLMRWIHSLRQASG